MATIGFLHTSSVHVPTFEALVAELSPGAEVATVVDDVLLDRARMIGPDHLEVVGAVADRLAELCHADVIVCTCSTIGEVAEYVGEAAGLEVVRVDRPMAERAVLAGERIVVLAAVESTLAPTESLLADAAQRVDRSPDVELRLVAGAWERFEAGDTDGYLDAVSAAIAASADSCDVVVLAQASMADAGNRVSVAVPVLSSPRLAVEAVVARAE